MENNTNNTYGDKDCKTMSNLKMGGVVLVALLSLFVLTKIITELKGLPSVGKNNPIMNTITVTGKGEVVTVPDIATFSFSVTEEALVVADAQKKSAEKINAILKFLKDSGVEDKDIKTSNYTIYPRYEYPVVGYYGSTGEQVLAGYVVSQSIEVKVRDLDNAGKLLSGIGEYGATDVSGLTFSVDAYDDLLKEAREKAIKEARSDAEKLAKDLGVTLVRITSYYDQGNYPPIYYAKSAMMDVAVGRGGEVAPELPSGESKIISNVSVTYEIR
ncbi:MAG TPA: SIMPL domain-containing protein [Candidatus Paceibacterota bacterium]|nr:SIMPL domain-containing protein [Candidatus Paceibacterota bacterium]